MNSITRFPMKDRLLATSMNMTPPPDIKADTVAFRYPRVLQLGAVIGGSIWLGAYGFAILLFRTLHAAVH